MPIILGSTAVCDSCGEVCLADEGHECSKAVA